MKNFILFILLLSTNIVYGAVFNTYSIGFTMNDRGESYIVESINISVDSEKNYFIRKIPRKNVNHIDFIDKKVSIIISQKNGQDKYEGKKVEYSFSSDETYFYYLFYLDNRETTVDLNFIYKTNYNLLTEKNDKLYTSTITLLEPTSWKIKNEGNYRDILLRDIKVSFIDKIQNEPRINNLRGILKNKVTIKIDYMKDLIKLNFIEKIKLDYKNAMWYFYGFLTLLILLILFLRYRK